MTRAHSLVWTAALTALFGLLPRAASAQEDGSSEEGPQQEQQQSARKMDVSVPGPGERVRRSAYVHEGFYLRTSVGPGWQWTSFNDRGDLNVDLSGNSFAFGVDLMIGASPSPGIALGLGVLSNTGLNMELDYDGSGVARTDAGHFIVGPFFDAFPDNRSGWHLGGELGFATSQFERQPNFVGATYGAGAAAWVGHDWWVAPEWSAGLMLRLSGAYMFGSQDEIDARSTAVTTTLLVTLLYH
jgi:hypothetical protein